MCIRDSSRDDWSKLALLDHDEDTLLVYNCNRLVVPRSDRRRVLELLHIAHPQAETAVNTARDRYFWPHMRQDVLNMIKTCPTCANRAPSKQTEPPVVNADHVALMRPMQEITVDYAEYAGKNFLIMVDRFSSCAFCEETKDKTIASTIKVMRKWFEHFGYPDKVRADNGPAFRAGFTEWLKEKK